MRAPLWTELLGEPGVEGARYQLGDATYVLRQGILRHEATHSDKQRQTRDTFGFKWQIRQHYESRSLQSFSADWLQTRYLGDDRANLDTYCPPGAKLLDAGCGAGYSALLLLGERLDQIDYLGVDISTAVDVARARFDEAGRRGSFMQADFTRLPFPPGTFDAVLAEGTLHHTDSTERAFAKVAGLLASGGHLMAYVYRRKGPVREFTDDHIRAQIAAMTDQAAWDALLPLSELGRALGQIDQEVVLDRDVDLLGIPAGRYSVQRLFYWHVAKAFYRRDLSGDEMNLINFDWYRPSNAHRHTAEEVRAWCEAAQLEVVRFVGEPAGISVVARKR